MGEDWNQYRNKHKRLIHSMDHDPNDNNAGEEVFMAAAVDKKGQ
jgi:hypothetical protein